jgi:hypothetical protein
MRMFGFMVILVVGRLTAPDPVYSNFHITLGDFFSDSNSPVIYRVGFMVNNPPQQINASLKIDYKDPSKSHTLNDIYCRHYSYHGFEPWSDNKKICDYVRSFCFFDLVNLVDNEAFSYSLIVDGKVNNGPFAFRSKVMSRETPKIVVFGDHDSSPNGMPLIDNLKKYDFDLLVFVGDLAYEIWENNGLNGDQYFKDMEPVIAAVPYIVIPGNHENIDNSLMLTNRFRMPSTVQPMDNNMFAFKLRNMLFVGFNFDLVLNMFIDKTMFYVKALDGLFAKYTADKLVRWVNFFTHRPMYCSQYNVKGNQCAQTIYYLKPFEDLLHKYGVHFYLTGHIHDYERYLPMHGFKIVNSKGPATIILGTGGNKEFFGPNPPFDIKYRASLLESTPGFSLLEGTDTSLTSTFLMALKDFQPFDVLKITSGEERIPNRIVILVLLFLLACALAAATVLVNRSRLSRNRKQVAELNSKYENLTADINL